MRALLLLVLLGLGAVPALGSPVVDATITYLTSSSVYVNEGTDDGLRAGDQLTVSREGEAVATLEVTEASNRRAVCSVVASEVDLKVGDQVRLSARTESNVSIAPAVSTADQPRPTSRGLAGAGIHGRVGLRFLGIRDRTGDGAEIAQPGIDLRLDGRQIAGSDFGLAVDIRSRRNYRTLAGQDDSYTRSRVYRFAVAWQMFGSPWNLVLGRQISPGLAMVSTFDGLSAIYARPRWSAGGFAGTQPDATDFGYSSDIREYGAYFQYRNAPQAGRFWAVTTGLVGSYSSSDVNREFLYVQGRYSGARLSAYGTTEVDVNRDWKEAAGEDSLSLTSGFASLHYRVSKVVTLRGGFDNRRSVRLIRDRITPETAFDDAYRRGGWAGLGLRWKSRYSASLDLRSSDGGTAGTASSYTATLGLDRLTKANLGFRFRGTGYENDRQEGWLGVLSVGMDLGRLVYFQVHGGVRDEQNLANPIFDDRMTWFGFDVDFNLGRRWYWLLSAESTSGDLEELDQYFTRLSYRF